MPPHTVLFVTTAEKKLRDQVRDVSRLRHLSLRTEDAYWNWIKCHPSRLPGAGTPCGSFCFTRSGTRARWAEVITVFLTHLAVDGRVAASTQEQAFNALLFFIGKS
jgi:hypothetical protein